VAGRRWIGLGLLVLVLLGWRAPPDRLMHALETWHAPANPAELGRYAGVVVLGGSFERASLQTGREAVQLNEHADRLTEAVALALAYPDLPIIFTGGCVDTGEGCVAEAVLAQKPHRAPHSRTRCSPHNFRVSTQPAPGCCSPRPGTCRALWPHFAPRAGT
jgi:uncharacterized SAM-binding protein YcdF (DUF218 family)